MKSPQSLLLLISLVAIHPTPIQGWGKDGHELVGNLAYHLLSPQTQKAVQQILAVDTTTKSTTTTTLTSSTNTPLGDIADWADQVRIHSDYHWSAALHYIDIHDLPNGCPVYHRSQQQEQDCHFDYARDCVDDVCVAGAIVNYTKHLGEYYYNAHKKAASWNQRLRGSTALLAPYKTVWYTDTDTASYPNYTLVQQSLMFLTHFIGDIHQPLHSGRDSDRGGNSIHVTFTIPSNSNALSYSTSHHHGLELHAVWDTSIIERAIHTEYNHDRDLLENDLMKLIHKANKTGEINHWLNCPDTRNQTCTSQWAEESWQNALQWAYANADGSTEVVSGTHLTDEYYQTRWPKIQQFLAIAGVRLAAALELVLGGTTSDKETAVLTLLK